jgi:2-polyprenyl-3-methyl-5-hydroxy-6-metoxy-1,4-benzoquinol methylase
MPNYGDPKYWEDRYKAQTDSTFDWLEDYETLKPLIDNLIINKENSKTIVLGCGNAEFSEQMAIDGYMNIYNIDIARNVIDVMKERTKDLNMICIIY